MPVEVESLARGTWSIGTSAQASALAWLALLGATCLLVRGEVVRSDAPAGVRIVSDVVYRRSNGRQARLDVYRPEGPAPARGRPALLAIHGGGWRGGGKGDFGRSLVPLVHQGFVVVAIDYRLSRPGSPSWPENLEDVQAAARWVVEHADEFAIDPDRVAALGSSAGGHLALLLALADDHAPIRAVIDFYAPTDLRALHNSGTGADRSIALLLGGEPERLAGRYAAASPLEQIRPGIPPVLIFHGDDDPLVPLGQSQALSEALQRAGVPYRLSVLPGARHGFGLSVGRRDLTPEIESFLEEVWGARR